MIPWVREWWPHAVGGLTVVAMAATAVHVLMSKRDPRSAVGWLGLVWFAPLLGVILYWFFGINRIRRRAREEFANRVAGELPDRAAAMAPEGLREWGVPENLVTLAGLTDRVALQPLMAGNRIVPLIDGDRAFPAMLEAIGGACRSVSLATYIFDDDRWGRRFQDALARAAARGVAVRVLIDDVGARYSFPSAVRRLHRAGVPVSRFMRTRAPWRFRYYNLRNHRKILVVDGREAFTGGMNIRGGNVLADAPRHPIRDLHFRVEGPVVAELQRAFADDWRFAAGETLEGEGWFPELPPRGTAVARAILDGPDEDFDKIRYALLGALACARRSIRIATPYFLPDRELVTGLRVAALRGVEVEILLPEVNNLRMVQWAATAGLDEILVPGCRIFLTPAPFDHTKLMTVDGSWVLLGSANWDARSLMLNFELNLECYGPELAGEADSLLDAKRNGGRELTRAVWEARPLSLRLRDSFFRLFSPYL